MNNKARYKSMFFISCFSGEIQESPSGRGVLNRQFSGFTLVELLVVISIIAILISILIPSLARARNISQSMLCMGNQRQIAMGLSSYSNEYKNYYPQLWTSGGSTQKDTWLYKLWTYVGYSKDSFSWYKRDVQLLGDGSIAGDSVSIFYCPVTRVLLGKTPAPRGCVAVSNPSSNLYCYGMNRAPIRWSLMCDDGKTSDSDLLSYTTPYRPDQRVRQFSRTCMTIDCSGYGTSYWWNDYTYNSGAPNGIVPHLGGANVIYFDAHGQSLHESAIPTWIAQTLKDATSVFWKGR